MSISITEYFFKVHKPPANQGKARLRGLYRIIYSKTISPTVSAPLGYQLSAITYRLFIQPASQRSARLSAISYRLSAIHSARRHEAYTGYRI